MNRPASLAFVIQGLRPVSTQSSPLPQAPGVRRLVALLETELESQADAHDRAAGGRDVAHRVAQSAPREVGPSLPGVAHAGDPPPIGPAQGLGLGVEPGGLGIDTLGVDPGIDEEFKTNTLLLRGHRIHLESMGGLEQMPANGGWIVVGGVRNEGGSGSPATVFGLVP